MSSVSTITGKSGNPVYILPSGRYLGSYDDLVALGIKDAHHIYQNAAVKGLPGYSRGEAPAISLQGPSNLVGTEHYIVTHIVQSQPGGGTLAAEGSIALRGLRQAGVMDDEARVATRYAWNYFNGLGATTRTITIIPGTR